MGDRKNTPPFGRRSSTPRRNSLDLSTTALGEEWGAKNTSRTLATTRRRNTISGSEFGFSLATHCSSKEAVVIHTPDFGENSATQETRDAGGGIQLVATRQTVTDVAAASAQAC